MNGEPSQLWIANLQTRNLINSQLTQTPLEQFLLPTLGSSVSTLPFMPPKSFAIESCRCPPNSSLSSLVHVVPLAETPFQPWCPATFALLLETRLVITSPRKLLQAGLSRHPVLAPSHCFTNHLLTCLPSATCDQPEGGGQRACLVLSSCPTPGTKQAHFMWNEWMWKHQKGENLPKVFGRIPAWPLKARGHKLAVTHSPTIGSGPLSYYTSLGAWGWENTPINNPSL